MITISMKSKYGLAAIFELALVYGQTPVRTKTIAENQGVPHKFLEAVLLQLKQGQLVSSFRGSHGGYQLARSPESITVFDVLNILEGPSSLGQFAGKSSVLQGFWSEAEAEVKASFNVTLGDLVNQYVQSQQISTYAI